MPRGRVRGLRTILPLALAMLLSATAAYAVVSAVVGGSGQHSAVGSTAPGWLGVDMTSFPLGGGAVVADVAPGGPADAAGLQPGDVITQINNQPVASPGDVESAVASMHAGQKLEIGYARGPIAFTTQVTLAARRSSP